MIEPAAAWLPHRHTWLGLDPFEINPNQLALGVQESDSHYHMKYRPKQAQQIPKPTRHEVAPRIQAKLETACAWYCQRNDPSSKSSP